MEVYGWQLGDKPLSIKIPIDIVQRLQDDIEYGLGMRTPCDMMGFLVGRLSKEYSASVVIREYVLSGYSNDRGGSGLWNDERLAEMIQGACRPKSQHYVVGLVRSSARGWPEIDKRELKIAKKLLKRTPNIFLLVNSGQSRTFTGRLFVRPTWRAKLDSEHGEFPLNSDILSAQWEATLPTAEKPSLHFVPGNPMQGRARWQPPTPAQPPHIEVVFERVDAAEFAPVIDTPLAETAPVIETPLAETAPVSDTAPLAETESLAETAPLAETETPAANTLMPEEAVCAEASTATAEPPTIGARGRVHELWSKMFRRSQETAKRVEVPIEIPVAEPAVEPLPVEIAGEPLPVEIAPEPVDEAPMEAMPESLPEETAEEIETAAASVEVEEEAPVEAAAQMHGEAQAAAAAVEIEEETPVEAPVEMHDERQAEEGHQEPLLRRMMDRILSYLIEEVPVEEIVGENEAESIAAESIAPESVAAESMETEPLDSSEPITAEQPRVIYSRTTDTDEYDGVAEESELHPPIPIFGDNPPPPPPQRLRTWLSIAATWTIAVGMTLWYLGGRNFFHRAEVRETSPIVVSNPVGLEVESNGGLLNIVWDGTSANAMHARGGYLTIRDGSLLKEVSLDSNELRAGHIYYGPRSSDLGIRLEMPQDSGLTVSESIRVVGPPPSAPGVRK